MHTLRPPMRKAVWALVWLTILQISIAFELDTLTKTDEGISVAFTSVPGFSRWSAPSNLLTSSQIVVECGGRKVGTQNRCCYIAYL